MSTVTTKAEQIRAGRLARQVGGYDQLLKLAGKRERFGRNGGKFERDSKGGFSVVATGAKR
jgi:hypothetical protein